MFTRLVVSCVFLLGAASSSYGATWSNSSIFLLRGENFEVGDDKARTEMTFENATGYKHGDSFFFLDVTAPGQAKDSARTTEMYGEWSPRFSLGKTFGFIKDGGFIKDVLFTNTFEFGNNSSDQSRTNLHGVALDFNIRNFAFFSWNFYVRDNLDKEGTTTQSTFAYKLPISIGESIKLDYSAYIDIVHGDEGDTEAHSHTGQQFKIDLGHLYKVPDTLFAGFEYQVWNKKFGIKDGKEEYNLKYFVQWQF
jgi:nucleoside-specific outer membrane channel protein Tsx